MWVDSTVGSGHGSIKVLSDDTSPFSNAPLAQGESHTYNNVTVEVLETTTEGDKVRVTVQ